MLILRCGARDDVRLGERGNALVATFYSSYWSRHGQAAVVAVASEGDEGRDY